MLRLNIKGNVSFFFNIILIFNEEYRRTARTEHSIQSCITVYNVFSVLAAIRTTIIRDHASHMRLPKRGLREKKCLEK